MASTHDAIDRALARAIDANKQLITKNTERIEHLSRSMTNVAWAASYVMNIISESARRLDNIIEKAKFQGIADTYEMSQLWNMTRLSDIPPNDTRIIRIERIGQSTLYFRLQVKIRDTDSSVVEFLPMTHVVMLSNVLKLAEYDGPRTMMLNMSSKCLKFLDSEPSVEYDGKCDQHKSIDERLWKNWNTEIVRKDLKLKPEVRRMFDEHYIQCYGWQITIDNEKHDCPVGTFKLPMSRSLTLDGVNYKVDIEKIRSSSPIIKPIELSLPDFISVLNPQLSGISTLDTVLQMRADEADKSKNNKTTESESTWWTPWNWEGYTFWGILFLCSFAYNYREKTIERRRREINYERMLRREPLIQGAKTVIQLQTHKNEPRKDETAHIYEEIPSNPAQLKTSSVSTEKASKKKSIPVTTKNIVLSKSPSENLRFCGGIPGGF